MNPEQWQKVKEIFDAALKREPNELSSFLDKACDGNQELRREVEILLASSENVGSFMDQAAIGKVADMFVSEDKNLQIGQRLGHFKIIEPLGAGGMGKVYLAEDLLLHRRVALKVLPDDIAADIDYLRRFKQEALAVSALNHPNILTIYEIVESNGSRFIASEYVKGETLRQTIQNLTVSETLDIAVQIAAALD
jgi:serine/threonine protein kinase